MTCDNEHGPLLPPNDTDKQKCLLRCEDSVMNSPMALIKHHNQKQFMDRVSFGLRCLRLESIIGMAEGGRWTAGMLVGQEVESSNSRLQ